MTTTLDLSLLIAQMPHVAQMANAAHTHPEMQQALFSSHARRQLLKEGRRIQKVEKKSAAAKVDEEPAGGGRSGFGFARRGQGPSEAPEEDSRRPSMPGSIIGNLVDMDV